jgi:hypothetical protein
MKKLRGKGKQQSGRQEAGGFLRADEAIIHDTCMASGHTHGRTA